jgi:hypothetical protein
MRTFRALGEMLLADSISKPCTLGLSLRSPSVDAINPQSSVSVNPNPAASALGLRSNR